MRIVDPFPKWYTPVKWLLPIGLALLTGLTVGLAVTGVLPIPFAFGKVAWLPAIYASLDAVKGATMLIGLSSGLSAIVGLTTSFVVRATLLFQVNEQRATQGQKAEEQIKELNEIIAAVEEERRYLREHRYNHLNESSGSISVEDSPPVAPVLAIPRVKKQKLAQQDKVSTALPEAQADPLSRTQSKNKKH